MEKVSDYVKLPPAGDQQDRQKRGCNDQQRLKLILLLERLRLVGRIARATIDPLMTESSNILTDPSVGSYGDGNKTTHNSATVMEHSAIEEATFSLESLESMRQFYYGRQLDVCKTNEKLFMDASQITVEIDKARKEYEIVKADMDVITRRCEELHLKLQAPQFCINRCGQRLS